MKKLSREFRLTAANINSLDAFLSEFIELITKYLTNEDESNASRYITQEVSS